MKLLKIPLCLTLACTGLLHAKAPLPQPVHAKPTSAMWPPGRLRPHHRQRGMPEKKPATPWPKCAAAT